MTDKYGTLTVRSKPSGAIATVDNMSKTTPAIFELKSRAPPYHIRIEKPGYDDYLHKVVIQRESKIEIDATLAKTR